MSESHSCSETDCSGGMHTHLIPESMLFKTLMNHSEISLEIKDMLWKEALNNTQEFYEKGGIA
jgi:hypothetical protein